MSEISKKYNSIVTYEEQFAKTVALKVRASREQPFWHFFIPFKFFFESRAIRLFVKNFLFVRKLSLDAARDALNGEGRQKRLTEIDKDIKDWLFSITLYSDSVHQKLMVMANLLFDHYYLLLKAVGKNYESLLRDAYTSRVNYESFLQKLSTIENEVDQAILAYRGISAELRLQMDIKQKAIYTLRSKETHRIFEKYCQVLL